MWPILVPLSTLGCIRWFGLDEFAAILAVVVNKIPNVVVTVREGTRSLDRNLLEMASLYRFGWVKTLRHVIAPQLYPFLHCPQDQGTPAATVAGTPCVKRWNWLIA